MTADRDIIGNKEYALFRRNDELETNVDLQGKFVICEKDRDDFYDRLRALCDGYRI